MADNVPITAGSDTPISTDELSDGSHAQQIKLLISANGDNTRIPATAANGLLVDVSRVTGAVTVADGGSSISIDDGGGNLSIDDGGNSITIDAPVGTPVFVRLSDGTNPITALPVTDNGGTLSIDDGGGSLTVDGAVTATQGTAAAASGGWPIKITDGTDFVGISTVSAAKALKVDVVQTVSGGQTDKTEFIEGSGKVGVAGGVFNDTISSDPAEDQAAALRITEKRGLHVNLRSAAGVEQGTATAPVNTTRTGRGETRVTKQVAATASQTGVTVWDPTGGTKFAVRKLIVIASVAGILTLFDETNSAANILFKGTIPAGVHQFNFEEPFVSATADNILKYTSDTGLTAEITVHGFEV